MCLREAPAQGENRVRHHKGFVGADAEFATRVRHALRAIGEREVLAPERTLAQAADPLRHAKLKALMETKC
jgi:hypothetical protein